LKNLSGGILKPKMEWLKPHSDSKKSYQFPPDLSGICKKNLESYQFPPDLSGGTL